MKFAIRVLAWFFVHVFHHVSYGYTKFHNFWEKNPHPYLLPSPMHAQPPTVSRLSVCMYTVFCLCHSGFLLLPPSIARSVRLYSTTTKYKWRIDFGGFCHVGSLLFSSIRKLCVDAVSNGVDTFIYLSCTNRNRAIARSILSCVTLGFISIFRTCLFEI
jgi:hypothetical protein